MVFVQGELSLFLPAFSFSVVSLMSATSSQVGAHKPCDTGIAKLDPEVVHSMLLKKGWFRICVCFSD